MRRSGKLAVYEVLTAGRSEIAGHQAARYAKPSEPDQPNGPFQLTVTRRGAFAAGALAVSSLALAFSLGRRYPAEARPEQPVRTRTLDEIRRQPPVSYDKLEIDRGRLD